MLPRLQAEEQLNAIRASGLAFGGYDKHDTQAMMRELREKASPDGKPPRAKKANQADLAFMGFGVAKVVPAPSEKGVSDGGR